MTERSHLPCPYCDSSDAYSYNEEKNVYRCFSCGAAGVLNKTYSCQEEEGLSLEPYIPDEYRGISKSVMEKHGVYFTKHEDKETVHYQYPNGTKHRELPKQIKISGKVDKFYGEDDYTSGRNITITEGEEDRLSVIQMMGDWPCVSVPGATPSKDFWENARKYLSNFEKIVLSVDSDEPGDKLADKFYRMFPGKVYRVNHGKYKDANDFLKSGDKQGYKNAWWNAQKVKPDTILSTAEDFEKLYDETPDYEYFPTGIDGLDEKMLGIHKGAFTLILAPSGIAKKERYYQFQIKTDMDTDDLIEQIRFLVTAMGVDYIFFEPIQDIIAGDTSTKESLLTDLSNKLKRLAPELNVGIVVIAHANDDNEVKYCRSIVQSAAYEIKLHRDLDSDDPTERNRMYVSVGRKNRTGGGSGPAGSLTFDKDTYMLTPDLGPIEPVFDKSKVGESNVGF